MSLDESNLWAAAFPACVCRIPAAFPILRLLPRRGRWKGIVGRHQVAASGLGPGIGGSAAGTETGLSLVFLSQVLQIDRRTDDPPAGEPLDSPAGIP